MATIKTTYVIQSCPKCQKQLLKVMAGTTIIGSPLITCKKCGTTYKTNLRTEWYNYQPKYMLWLLPLLLTVSMLAVGVVMGEPAIGVAAAIFGLLFGLGFTIKDLIRMIKSKKRMRDPKHLENLLLYGVISPAEYKTFTEKLS